MTLFIDSNVFGLAFMDPQEKGNWAREILDKVARGQIKGVTSALVIDEVMWILIKNKAGEIKNAVENIYEMPNLKIEGITPDQPLAALEFIEIGLKPRDAMHCAFMEKHGIRKIASDDADFDKVKEFKRIKP